ncbi:MULTISPECIES: VOC family protein [Actinomyces]|uniref:VOC family protein n=1 Tax=Actinomyces TaxID=1654 RepID=UPI001356E615|nr:MULTISPECIES: VOC family protein [Actinomyces]
MRTGHVIYWAQDLDAAVRDFRERGFAVEYGSARRPINALVYFSEGPYLELLARTLPTPLLRLASALPTASGRATRRFTSWERGPEGLRAVCLEGGDAEFDEVVERFGARGLRVAPTRIDTHGRRLHYRVFFPEDPEMPFFMTRFSQDPRPRDFTHPNGARAIARVEAPLSDGARVRMAGLCDDGVLAIQRAPGAMRVIFDDGTELV